MKQPILVLGATGFIGEHVVAALEASDWATPISASRRSVPAAGGGQASSIRLDATDAAQIRRAMEGVHGVVNCVAGSGETIVNSTRALFGVAAGLPNRPRIVHLSSLAIYGGATGDVVESTLPTGALSAYGSAKLEAERLATPQLSLVVLRPGIVYGPGSVQWSGRIASLLHSRRLGDLGKAGDGCCNLVYVDDVVGAILVALRRPELEGKTFNLSLPQPPTWNDYFVRYAKALGAVPVARITKRRLAIESKILAPPLKIAQIILGKLGPRFGRLVPQPIPPSLVRTFGQEIRMRVECAEKALGLAWTPLDDGLRQAATWYHTGT
jgi:nucleoside-diphosphate-sugar epimerase